MALGGNAGYTRTMIGSLIRAIVILPGTALVFVPALVLWLAHDEPIRASLAGPTTLRFWCALAIGTCGLALAVWTVRLFLRIGQGTPAPWDPPRRLVVQGPYRHVRNPMITSVLAMLLAESLLFASWPLAVWMLIFFAVNAVYFPLSEEKGLEKRFGEDYRIYRDNVPRWIPRLRPWTQP